MIRQAITSAQQAGASLRAACEQVGISARTLQRWSARPATDDGRCGPRRMPANALSQAERSAVVRTLTAPEFRDLPPKQVVPRLADRGQYLASESTMYRILRAEGLQKHRGRARPSVPRVRPQQQAAGPNQLWSWDITYLRTTVRGTFLYLYLVMDVWSRKIVGWQVHEHESSDHAAVLVRQICESEGIDPKGLVLHSDNGAPMKGATMLATLQKLGVVSSFSRPATSNDNPYSEALFRTLKYGRSFPEQPFEGVAAARAWVERFVRWYNTEHRHSAIRFVTPEQRHRGTEKDLLSARRALYERAWRSNPERWSGRTRNWEPVGRVTLQPDREVAPKRQAAA